jgi:sigma-54-specific transcriptional regulator
LADIKSLLTYPEPRALTKSVRASALVFEDPVSRTLLERIERIAPSEANVLIIGETGTGKEIVARHVHDLSRRKNGQFLAVNCGSLTETLVESELFGHERGAFTGALAAKEGWFEAADGGTLFLDEIGDLPLSMQVKLLRVLQEREVVRVGSRTSRPIDVRVIAATNVQLEGAVAAGRFREDLFYRLRVASLILPPLRDRTRDILPLAYFFLKQHRDRLGYAKADLSQDAERALVRHNWLGNIRELENAIHHALLVCDNGLIEPEDLQLVSGPQITSARTPENRPTVSDLEGALADIFETGGEALFEQIEDRLFRAAFNYCHRNQVQTAKLLGISRNIVRARLIRIGEIGGMASAEPLQGTNPPSSHHPSTDRSPT